MRKFFRRLFHIPYTSEPVQKPDDRQLMRLIDDASEKHKRMTMSLKNANLRQIEDAEYIRETLRGVLTRIEERKAHQNG